MSHVISGNKAREYLSNHEFVNNKGAVYLGWRLELAVINEARKENVALALPLILKSIINADENTLWRAIVEDQKGTSLEMNMGVDMRKDHFFAGTVSENSKDQVNMYNALALGKAISSDTPTLNRP